MQDCKVDIKRVMAALDLSSYSEITFQHALTLARDLGAELILVNVINTRGFEVLDRLAAEGYDLSRDKYVAQVEAERTAQFEKEYLPKAGGVPVRFLFRAGLPQEELLKAAKELDASMIVMGAKGRGNLAGALFGSTAEKVFRRAACPVVSVRGPEHCRLPG